MSRAGWTALILSVFTPCAGALDAELSGRAALWSSSRNLDDEQGLTPVQLWLRSSTTAQRGDAVIRAHGEGWAELQPSGTSDHWDGHVREAYAQLSKGALELRAGWQIFAWGRTDGINPTDNLTPRQLTFLTRDTEDQRFGVPAVRATWFSGPVSVSLIWLAGFEPSEIPLPADGPRLSHEEPEDEAGQWATRLDFVSGEIEGSFSYFDGYDVLPTQVVLASMETPHGLMLHQRLKIAGGDIAKTVGRFGLRAEAAYLETPGIQPNAVFARQSQWYAVAGGDRTFGEYLNVNLQLYYRHVDDAAVPQGLTATEASLGRAFALAAQQYDRIDRGLTFRIGNQWLHETLEANVSGVVSTTRNGYLVRPLIKYRATDTWTLSLGGEIWRGGADSAFGFLRDNTSVYLELRRGF